MFMLYLRLIGANIRSQMQHRVSFWLDLVGFGVMTVIEFATTAILLARFGSVGGWNLPEVALLYGLSSIAFGIAEMVGRGFDSPFELMMQTGSFDSVLIRPLGTFFQILTSAFQLRRLGRITQGIAILAYALSHLAISWTWERLLILPVTVISGASIFISLAVIGATITFWTIKTPEVINIFTHGGQQITSFPLSVFNEWIRGVFLFIIPVGFASYPAGLLILGRVDPNGLPAAAAWAAPAVAAIFFGAAFAFWQRGVSKYASTGS